MFTGRYSGDLLYPDFEGVKAMMNYDSFEQASLDHPVLNISEKLTELNSGFKSRWTPEYEAFLKMPKNIDGNIYCKPDYFKYYCKQTH